MTTTEKIEDGAPELAEALAKDEARFMRLCEWLSSGIKTGIQMLEMADYARNCAAETRAALARAGGEQP